MNKMALINLDYSTVELFEDTKELGEIINRYEDDIKGLENKIIVSEDRILKILKNKEEIKIINYYDKVARKSYPELSYEQWKREEKRNSGEELNELAIYQDLLDE